MSIKELDELEKEELKGTIGSKHKLFHGEAPRLITREYTKEEKTDDKGVLQWEENKEIIEGIFGY